MTEKDRKYQPERAYWLALSLCPDVGARTFALLRHQGLEADLPLSNTVLHSLETILPKRALQGLARFDFSVGKRLEEICIAEKISFWTWSDDDYPPLLRTSRSALPVLYYLGRLPTTNHAMAMVGTRAIGPWSAPHCQNLVFQLPKNSCTIVSGLAQGIDSCCHEAALTHRLPTVAVLAQGLERLPGGTRTPLAKRILQEGGCITSPFPPRSPVLPACFVQRNAIIAGLSHTTLLVESRIDGGAMHTVRYALADSRTVLAIPGDPWRPGAQGANHLLAQNLARAVWRPEDLPSLLGFSIEPTTHKKCNDSTMPWPHLRGSSLSIDELADRTGKKTSELLAILTLLEIQGLCKVQDGHWVVFY